MNETFKFLTKTITRNWGTRTNEELCEIYKKTNDDEIISYMFCNNIQLWKRIANKYGFFIEKDSIPSYILEYISKALRTYGNDRPASLLTYMTLCVRNALISLNLQAECKNIDYISYDNEVDEEKTFLVSIENKDAKDEFYDKELEETIINNDILTDAEKRVCILIIRNEALTRTEIAQEMGVIRQTVYSYIKSLRSKILQLI